MNKMTLSLTVALLLAPTIQAKESRKLDTITVTAQKVEENPKDVPITMNVFDKYAVEDKNIHSIANLSNHIPGFFLFNLGDNGTAAPSLRGIHSDYRTVSSSVALYIDGVPSLTTMGYNTYLYDIERIEVLKGPQGTLYGKNAEAGVINIVTKQPNNEIKGKIALELGEDKKKQATFNVSGPIVKDNLFIGIAGRYYEKDGFIKNSYLNKNVNDKNSYSGRLNFRYLANDNLELSLIADKDRRRDDGGSSSLSSLSNPYTLSLDLEEKNSIDVDSLAFKINYNINKNNTIEAITSYKTVDTFSLDDYDKTSVSSNMYHSKFNVENKNISQELRYKVKEDNYNYLMGLFLDKSNEKSKTDFKTAYSSFVFENQEIDAKSFGAFTHMDYQITNKLSILAGLRYDKDTKEFENKLTLLKDKESFSEVSPKLALKYRLNKDTLTYATIAKGYKPGSYFMWAPSGYEYFEKETLISYELGLKSSFLDNKLNLNTALYYIDISDKQINVALSNVSNYMKNANSATSKGFELEASYMISDAFSVSSSFAYNKATFDDFKYTSLIVDNTNAVIGTKDVDNSGNYLPHTPKYTYSLGFQYRGDNGIYANTHLNGVGDFYTDDSNTFKRNAYYLVDAKIGYETDSYDIYLYGKNIFDKDYTTEGNYGSSFLFLSKPREIGVQLAYRF